MARGKGHRFGNGRHATFLWHMRTFYRWPIFGVRWLDTAFFLLFCLFCLFFCFFVLSWFVSLVLAKTKTRKTKERKRCRATALQRVSGAPPVHRMSILNNCDNRGGRSMSIGAEQRA